MFGPKAKYFFVDASTHAFFLARGGYDGKRLVVDVLESVATKDPEAITKAVDHLGGFAHGEYVQSHCGVYPASAAFHRHKLPSANKVENAAYFTKIATEDYQMDPKQFRVALGSLTDGKPVEVGKDKLGQVFFFGAKEAELRTQQEALLAHGVYPLSLQLGTIATIGALLSYCEHAGLTQPLLFMEFGPQVSHLFVLSNGISFCRNINLGLESMYPQLMQQLGFDDPKLVRDLIFSNTFDFSEVGPSLLQGVLKEVQSALTYFEGQTGQSVSLLFISLLPESLRWVSSVLGQSLGIKPLEINYTQWLSSVGIDFSDKVNVGKLDDTIMGLLGLMCTVTYV